MRVSGCTASLVRTGAVCGSRDALGFIEQLCKNPELVPARYWSVRAESQAEDEEQVLMRGAVLVRVRGKRGLPAAEGLNPELRAAIEERPIRPGRELLGMLRESGRLGSRHFDPGAGRRGGRCGHRSISVSRVVRHHGRVERGGSADGRDGVRFCSSASRFSCWNCRSSPARLA